MARLSVGYDHNGKRLRKTVYGRTKRDVQDELAKLQHRKSTGALTNSSKRTVGQFLDRWLEDAARLTVRPSTYRRYGELVNLHVKPRIGGVRLHRLTATDVQGIFSAMERAGRAARTRQFTFDLVKGALDDAVKLGLIAHNVCGQLTRPRAPKTEMMTLDKAQAMAFLEASESDGLYTMYLLAVMVGVRQGELFGLYWSDIDFEAGTLKIVRALKDDRTLGPPKTKKSRRTIDLPKVAIEALHEHRKEAVRKGRAGNEFVFCNTMGGALYKSDVRRAFLRILNGAGLPTIRFHDLRHTCATLMLLAGVNAKVVSEQLGHATVAFTLDTYAQVLPSMGKEAARTMDRLLFAAGG